MLRMRWVSIVAMAASFAPSAASAQAGAFSARIEAGAGAMLSDYQRGSLDYDALVAGGAHVGYAPIEPLVFQVGWIGWYGPSPAGSGSQSSFEGGVRLEIPIAQLVRPWVDGNAGVALTGGLARFGITAGLGVEFDVLPILGIGVYGRYGHTFAAGEDYPADAMMLVGGVTATLRLPEADPEHTPPPSRDRDRDGVADGADVCPELGAGAHPDPQRAGCPMTDGDSDGVTDRDDVCPTATAGDTPDPDRPGCPAADADHDGVIDRDDACPTSAPGAHPDPARRGCPDGDDDNDRVLNSVDRCRAQHRGPSPDPARPGCPLPDRDADSVVDSLDHCPDEAGAPHPDPGRNGCPGLVRIEGYQLRILRPVFFATNADRILPRSRPVLQALADALVASPWIRRLSIEGHTDDVGEDAQNLELSERRAANVMAWLIQHGIEPARLVSHGFGETRPLIRQETEDARAVNRRVEFHVIELAGGEEVGRAR